MFGVKSSAQVKNLMSSESEFLSNEAGGVVNFSHCSKKGVLCFSVSLLFFSCFINFTNAPVFFV